MLTGLASGIASRAAGGKFEHGFLLGAVTYLFNHAAHAGRGPAKADGLRYRMALANQNDKYLVFDGQHLLVLDQSDDTVLYMVSATSGRGDGLNNPAMQDVPFVGPIPEGAYTFSSSGWKSQSFVRQIYNILRGNGDWGYYNVSLNPLAPHAARDSFYIHGGFFAGSAGCIDAGGHGGQSACTDCRAEQYNIACQVLIMILKFILKSVAGSFLLYLCLFSFYMYFESGSFYKILAVVLSIVLFSTFIANVINLLDDRQVVIGWWLVVGILFFFHEASKFVQYKYGALPRYYDSPVWSAIFSLLLISAYVLFLSGLSGYMKRKR